MGSVHTPVLLLAMVYVMPLLSLATREHGPQRQDVHTYGVVDSSTSRRPRDVWSSGPSGWVQGVGSLGGVVVASRRCGVVASSAPWYILQGLYR